MSKILKSVSAFICLLMVAMNVQSDPVRVFQETVSNPKSWDNFKKLTIGNGWADEQKGVNVGRVSAMACRQAVEKNGLVALKDGGKCVESFMKWNELSTETIAFEEFRTMVMGKGLYVASIEEMQSPLPVAKVVNEKPKLHVSAADSKVVALDAKVKAMDEGNSTFKSGVTGMLASINKKLKNFQQDVEGVGNVIDAKVDEKVGSLKASNDAQNKRITGLEGGMKTLAAAGVVNSEKINSLNKVVNGNAEAANNNFNSIAVGLLVLFLAVVGLTIKTWRQSGKFKKLDNAVFGTGTVNGVVGKVSGLEKGLSAVIAGQETDGMIVDELSGRVEVLAKQHQFLSQTVGGISFDEAAIQSNKLSALKIGDKIEFVLKFHHDDSESRLEVERTGENQVTVHGALRQPGKLAPLVIDSLEGVSAKIYRAAKSGRIVGVVQSDPQVFSSKRPHLVMV